MLMSKPLEHSSKIGDESLRIDNDKSLPLELSTLKRKFMSSTSKQDLNFLENSPTNRPRPEFSERTYTLNLNSVTNESSPRIIPAGSIGSLVPIEIGSRGVSKKKGNGSPRGEFMRSTFGMSRASLLGTKQSDFFSDIDNDAELLQRFRDAQKSKHSVFRTKLSIFRTKDDGSNTARDDSQTSKIKFNGLRTQLKGFSGISKEHLLKAKKVSDLRQLADLFREKNMEDLKLLEGKTLELTQELNSITERNEKKQKVLYQLEETYERLLKETNDDASVVIPDVSQSVAKASNLEENYEALKNQENRLNQIIEICNVNKNQNDEWLRQLGFYSENLNKCIEEKRSQAKEVDREAGLADSNFSLLKDWFKSREANNQELITALDKIQTDNQVLQSQFMVTENLIQRSIEKTKRRLEERAEDRLKQLDENTKERAVSAKNRRIQKELNHKKETLQKYAQIFADGADGQHWTEKPEIKELLDNLAEKKELEKELMQLGFELKEKKMKNSELKRRIEVANQTKAINGHNRDLEDLRKEESRKKHQLEQEKEKVIQVYEDSSLRRDPQISAESDLGRQFVHHQLCKQNWNYRGKLKSEQCKRSSQQRALHQKRR